MAQNRYVGDYPVIGIRPIVDGRRGPQMMRESLEPTVWAMAKAADDDVPDPKTWVRQFDDFPIDVIAPQVFELVLKGMVSSKNWKRLTNLISQIKKSQPESTSTQSSSPESNED